MCRAIAVFSPSCFSTDIPPIPVSVPLGVSRRPVRAHLPLPVCDKKIKGLRTVALEFRTEVRLDLCRRASLLFALKFEPLLKFKCILRLQHAVAYSKMFVTAVQFFLALQSKMIFFWESGCCIPVCLLLNCCKAASL